MTGAFEGDRPLGLVTLQAAHAEGEIDELLGLLPAPESFDDSKRRWQVGRKLQYAQKLVREMKAKDLSGLLAALKEGRSLFERRNELVHGRLFAGGRLVSNQLNVADRRISAEDIVALSEEMANWKERLWMLTLR
jgi:hypothetical protein